MAAGNSGQIAGQYDVISLADGFHDQDMAALARVSAAEREAQLDAGWRLWRYTDQLWDDIKAAGTRSPAQDPRYSAVAAMRDLLAELRAHAASAIHAAGDAPS